MDIDDVNRLCVVGSGTMGSQIAMQCALHGYDVLLCDLTQELLNKAMATNRAHLTRRVEKGKMTQEQLDESIDRITCTTKMEEAASRADFVIEAIFEKLDLKKEVFSRLDGICPPNAIIATNSSYFGNSLIASATKRPEKIVNMHFFNPVLVMKLVEVVKGEKTSEETLQITTNLVKRIDRVPVILAREIPGFVVNRIVMAIRREAFSLLEHKIASFKDIDTACELGLNFPLGPFKLMDFNGLDVSYNAMMELNNITKDPKDLPPKTLQKKIERGELGRKTGRGFYEYAN